MVDMTQENGEQNFLDEQNSGRRPYLIMIDRSNVINWSIDYTDGKERVQHATIRQFRQRSVPAVLVLFLMLFIRVLRPNLVETYRLEKQGREWVQIKEREVVTSIPVVPIVWYGAIDPHFASGDMPLNALAELSIQHFQMRSDLQELLHKVQCQYRFVLAQKLVPTANQSHWSLALTLQSISMQREASLNLQNRQVAA